MACLILQMLSLGSLLIHSASPVVLPRSSRLTEEAYNNRLDNLQKVYDSGLGVPTEPPPRTCREAAGQMQGQMNNRSLSPWTYRLDQDPSRIPSVIAFAQCLCEACIIQGKEDHDYNSVMVYASLLVFRKTPCGNGRIQLTKDFIRVPVACTCVVPKHNKRP